MKSKIVDWWLRIQASYWFIPSLMAISAIMLSVIAVHIDTRLGSEWLGGYPWLYANQPAGARALLSTVAGSMITVAGVTFSMTLLAVSHASSQIGPRLLAGFMRDRGNQFTLGTFIATFLYCLLILRTVRGGSESASDQNLAAFVPHLAILLAVALAIMSVAVLIYFIHHVPQSISITNVVARVGDELVRGVEKMYPEQIGQTAEVDAVHRGKPRDLNEDGCDIYINGEGGYLRVLDSEGLLHIAIEHELIIKLELRPGDFAIGGQRLLSIWPAEKLDQEVEDAIQGLFSWGPERTGEQDLLFPTEQLIEVLGKAMSPGVNGQYTALLCLNQFERVFSQFLQRQVPDRCRYDENDKPRIIAKPVTHEEFLFNVLTPVRQFVRGDWITTNHLLKMLKRLIAMPQLKEAMPLLEKEIAHIRDDVEAGSLISSEKTLLLATADS